MELFVVALSARWGPRPRVDNAMVKALARAFRWRRMLDEGVHATLEDLATAKGVHATYVSRVVRLTLLAPDIVEALGHHPASSISKGSMAEPRTRPLYSYRDDPAVPRFDDSGPVAIMDGECVLCATGARAIARFDRVRSFRIGRTESAVGAALVRHYGLEPDDPETWLYLEDGRAWSGMEAIIRIGARLGGPGRLLGIMRICPRSVREWLYRRIAHNRYRFGRTDMCDLPDPELRARLLQSGDIQ